MSKKPFIFILAVMLMSNCYLSAKIRLLTFHYNNPKLIEIQHTLFQKFMQNSYELIVFNDAKDPLIAVEIAETCKKYGLQCVRYKQQWHAKEPLNYQIAEWLKDPNIIDIHQFISPLPEDIGQHPAVRHCHVIKYAVEKFGYKHNDIVVLVDGDAFPIKPLNIRSLLVKHPIIGLEKTKTYPDAGADYLWVVFIAFQPKLLPNIKDLKFDISVINNKIYDTGSSTYHYLNNNPKVKYKKYQGIVASDLALKPVSTLLEEGFSNAAIELIKKNDWPPVEFHLNGCLFHCSNSSRYLNEYERKEANIMNFVNTLLEE